MTIREAEALLGMTRANIRFYEQEGLVEPRREKNGYRDYSPEDIEALRKIKLLRQLKLPVETIRQIQRGERFLADAMADQAERLRQEQADLAWAAEICRAMREERASYETLDARRYLERLDRPADRPGYFNLERDQLPTVSYPWRRYWARQIDLSVYSLLWTAVQMLLLRWNPGDGLLINLLESYIGFGLMLLLEPLMLCTWGSTPGKWIFGLEVRDAQGRKLTWWEALQRAWDLFARGFGYGIPIYNIVRLVKCCTACSRGEVMEWDEGIAYSIRDTRPLRWLGFCGAGAALVGAVVLVTLQANMPIHRGALTPQEYAENVNDIIQFQRLGIGRRMDSQGNWDDGGSLIVISMGEELPSHQLTVEDGIVTGVRIEVEGGGQIASNWVMQKQLAALALIAARPGYNCVSWSRDGTLGAIAEKGFDNYTLQAGGMTVRQEFTSSGYRGGSGFLFAEEGARNPYYHLVFTIKQTGGP